MVELEMREIAGRLEEQSPADILRWAVDRFDGRVTFGTGFGAEGCVLIDVIGRERLPIDIFTLDTGLLFPETYELWRGIEARYGIKIRAVRPELTVEAQAVAHGPALWSRDPDRCCAIRKVGPLTMALEGFDAWVTAIRRDQTHARANAQVLEADPRSGRVKVNPLVRLTNRDVWSYIFRHDVRYNPLHDRGYPSIGCWPCTSAVRGDEEDARAGRWRGSTKTECGLHVTGDEPAAKEGSLSS